MNTIVTLLDWITGILAILFGIGYLWLWRAHRFWLPRYAHFLAAGATLLAALGLCATRPAQGGFGKEALLLPLMPFCVYFVVVFFGGAEAARRRDERRERDG